MTYYDFFKKYDSKADARRTLNLITKIFKNYYENNVKYTVNSAENRLSLGYTIDQLELADPEEEVLNIFKTYGFNVASDPSSYSQTSGTIFNESCITRKNYGLILVSRGV